MAASMLSKISWAKSNREKEKAVGKNSTARPI
jgi:hypothetical protein